MDFSVGMAEGEGGGGREEVGKEEENGDISNRVNNKNKVKIRYSGS